MKTNAVRFSIALLFALTSFVSFCQGQPVSGTTDTFDMAEVKAALRQQEKERQALRQHFDSLFLKKKYQKIIEECDSRASDAQRNSVVRYNAIAAHFFAGDTALSRALVEKELAKYTSGFAASTLLSENLTGYLYFLSVPGNWEYIEKRVQAIAMLAAEKHTEKEKEVQLFDFFIADQKNRLFHDYTAENQGRPYKFTRYKTKEAFDATAEEVCKEIFAFYKKEGKLFSAAEVGELHYIQLVFLLHESDTERRAYYLELMDKAVHDGVFPINKKLDFLIASELIRVNWEHMTKVVAEQEQKLRVEYDLPDYTFSLVM